jgi:hypothetical protein
MYPIRYYTKRTASPELHDTDRRQHLVDDPTEMPTLMPTDTTDQHRSPIRRPITDSHAELRQRMISDHDGVRQINQHKIRQVVGSIPTRPTVIAGRWTVGRSSVIVS